MAIPKRATQNRSTKSEPEKPKRGIPASAAASKVKRKTQPAPAEEKLPAPDEVDSGFVRDPKTGKKYYKIPRPKIEDDRSDVLVNDLAGILDDPALTADKYLAHLRVAPTPEELAEIRAARLKQAREHKEARARQLKEDEESE